MEPHRLLWSPQTPNLSPIARPITNPTALPSRPTPRPTPYPPPAPRLPHNRTLHPNETLRAALHQLPQHGNVAAGVTSSSRARRTPRHLGRAHAGAAILSRAGGAILDAVKRKAEIR